MSTRLFADPNAIAREGERIYRERFKSDFEQQQRGKFVAIDVSTEEAFLGNTPKQAMDNGRARHPDGVFHLMRVGFPAAFRVGQTSLNHAQNRWNAW